MSRKNHKNRAAAPTTTADRHLHAVTESPDQQNPVTTQDAPITEDKVRAALAEHPGSTTAELAKAAGVGRSTAAKILARWGRDGTATRTESDGPRNPDTWTLASSDTTTRSATSPPGSDPATGGDDAAVGNDNIAATDHAVAQDSTITIEAPDTQDATTQRSATTEPAATDDVVGDGQNCEATTAATADEAKPNSASSRGSDGTEDDAPTLPADADLADAASSDAEGSEAPPQDSIAQQTAGSTDPTDDATPASSSATAAMVAATADTAPTAKERLPKGGLRGLVEDYLAERPGESFGPAKIGKDLGRSGGAVNNALEKLAADGYATKTCEAPKRFAIKQDTTLAAT
jgi:DNA-binding MarR family transcriptional regulator